MFALIPLRQAATRLFWLGYEQNVGCADAIHFADEGRCPSNSPKYLRSKRRVMLFAVRHPDVFDFCCCGEHVFCSGRKGPAMVDPCPL